MRRDEKEVTTLSQQGVPYVDPKLSGNPAAARYAQGLAARKGGQLVAGGPTPPIPRLDSQAREGMTMSDQARAQMQMMQPSGQSIIAPQMQQNGFFPTDMLLSCL